MKLKPTLEIKENYKVQTLIELSDSRIHESHTDDSQQIILSDHLDTKTNESFI